MAPRLQLWGAMTRIALCSLVLGGVLAACNDSQVTTRTKGSTSRGSAAQDAGQQVGSTARRSSSRSSYDGDVYEGVVCDAYAEGLAWCDDDYTLAYCSAGTWWLVDCWDVGEDYCVEDAFTVDCDSYY